VSVSQLIAPSALACGAMLLLAACEHSAESTATDELAATGADPLPDWSGWWAIEGGPLAADPNGLRAKLENLDILQPEARRIVESRAPGVNPGGGAAYCIPTRFNGGINGGRTNDVEFLLMPKRLTITNGDGLLRRIPIDGRSLREDPEPSNGGTSVGKWDGDTLVIETIGLFPDTTFPAPSRPEAPTIGENVRVMERIRLNEQDQLVVETELTAPDMLVAALNFTTTYVRDPDYVYRDHNVCSLNDRSIDPVTGYERFDMTPPPDLPPPPPR
jgi:hypothetical protein